MDLRAALSVIRVAVLPGTDDVDRHIGESVGVDVCSGRAVARRYAVRPAALADILEIDRQVAAKQDDALDHAVFHVAGAVLRQAIVGTAVEIPVRAAMAVTQAVMRRDVAHDGVVAGALHRARSGSAEGEGRAVGTHILIQHAAVIPQHHVIRGLRPGGVIQR